MEAAASLQATTWPARDTSGTATLYALLRCGPSGYPVRFLCSAAFLLSTIALNSAILVPSRRLAVPHLLPLVADSAAAVEATLAQSVWHTVLTWLKTQLFHLGARLASLASAGSGSSTDGDEILVG